MERSSGDAKGLCMWNEPDKAVPKTNVTGYQLVYIFEVAIRELIIELAAEKHDSRWYKHLLPGGNIMEKYEAAKIYERKTPWSQCVPAHPMYYLDLPELREVIGRRDNWKTFFGELFSNRDVFLGAMQELEPIRNKIAHNRTVTAADVKILHAALDKLRNSLGASRLAALVARQTAVPDLASSFQDLRVQARACYLSCRSFQPMAVPKQWEMIVQEWWFDSDYLGVSVEPIIEFFQVIETYMNLPRGRGSGHRIEEWVRKQDLGTIYDRADNTLSRILEQ